MKVNLTHHRWQCIACIVALTLLVPIIPLKVLSIKLVQADELQKLSAAQIETLLTGNTAMGEWDGTAYRQYFSENGRTEYAAVGSVISEGKWRVNRRKDLYESWWMRSDWSSYGLSSSGETYYWISPSLPPQAFTVVTGDQLEAP